MAKRPDVSAIAQQVIERLKQIEDQVTQNQRFVDELARLRDAVNKLERAVVLRLGGERVPAAELDRADSAPNGNDAATSGCELHAPSAARRRRAVKTRPRSSRP